MYEVFIQPTYAYNELEREIQALQFSYLIRDEGKNEVKREDLTFPPVMGVDTSLLLWLGIRDKMGYRSNFKTEVQRAINMINSEYSNCKVISWYNELEPLPEIRCEEKIDIYSTLRKNMKKAYKELLGKELESNFAQHKLNVMVEVYDKINEPKEQQPLTEVKPNITTNALDI